ncbi:MAG TPA: hypothetical protein VN879_01585 [Candidatus Acidoferrales bacterium]|nr:hypothetical protein [Candidatus Acidoferrales bacterium]
MKHCILVVEDNQLNPGGNLPHAMPGVARVPDQVHVVGGLQIGAKSSP